MIVAFSTSSPLASVALIDEDGRLIAEHSEEAPMRASGACMTGLERLLEETSLGLERASAFLADLGPGSFTGVRVGVTLAKTLAFARGVRAAGLSSFDLISADQTVAIPSKKGEFIVRKAGCEPVRIPGTARASLAPLGYGPGSEEQVYPHAARFAPLLSRLMWLQPEALVPLYLIEPSISQPKKPYAPGAVGA